MAPKGAGLLRKPRGQCGSRVGFVTTATEPTPCSIVISGVDVAPRYWDRGSHAETFGTGRMNEQAAGTVDLILTAIASARGVDIVIRKIAGFEEVSLTIISYAMTR